MINNSTVEKFKTKLFIHTCNDYLLIVLTHYIDELQSFGESATTFISNLDVKRQMKTLFEFLWSQLKKNTHSVKSKSMRCRKIPLKKVCLNK